MFFFSMEPAVVAMRSKYSPTSDSVIVRDGSCGKLSATVSPASPCFDHDAQISSPLRPVTSDAASLMIAPPTPVTRSSRRGNGDPEKKTTARSSEASSSVRRYSARSRSFSSFFVVAPIAFAITVKSESMGSGLRFSVFSTMSRGGQAATADRLQTKKDDFDDHSFFFAWWKKPKSKGLTPIESRRG